jgi:hypothetical protein
MRWRISTDTEARRLSLGRVNAQDELTKSFVDRQARGVSTKYRYEDIVYFDVRDYLKPTINPGAHGGTPDSVPPGRLGLVAFLERNHISEYNRS